MASNYIGESWPEGEKPKPRLAMPPQPKLDKPKPPIPEHLLKIENNDRVVYELRGIYDIIWAWSVITILSAVMVYAAEIGSDNLALFGFFLLVVFALTSTFRVLKRKRLDGRK